MKIIKQLRIKVIFSIVGVQFLFLSAIFLGLNFIITRQDNNVSLGFLHQMAKNKGHGPLPQSGIHYQEDMVEEATLPEGFETDFFESNPSAVQLKSQAATSPIENLYTQGKMAFQPEFGTDQHMQETVSRRNYFAVNVSYEGAINELIQDFPLSYTKAEISNLVLKIMAEKKETNTVNGFQYFISPAPYGNYLICILNKSSELASLKSFRMTTGLVFLAGLIFSFCIAYPISRLALKQAAGAFEKQKQFIADAGHELKTPIAVIGANIDVLSSDEELKANKFFQYIKHENERMGELVKDLLYLARDDAERLEIITSEFDFSNAVENALLPFEVIAFESGMQLSLDIERGIICNGEEKSLKQLFVILVDNAIKNSDKGALITVRAFSDNQKIYYKVKNTGAGISKEDLQKIFLRFYRSDSSRARKTGGYGLGLSIAQTIAKNHGGVLSADSQQGEWAEFTLTLPRKQKKS